MHDLEGTADGAISWWNQSKSASAHFIIRKNGSVIKCVEPENIAWHAGTTSNTGRTAFWKSHNINGYSIGIELEGYTTDHYTDEQYNSLIRIGKWAKRMYDIPAVHSFDTISGWHLHSEISNQRSDPGPNFDMQRVLSALG